MDNMYFNPFAQNVAIIKNYFKRKSVLVMAIMTIIMIPLSIFSMYFISNAMPELLDQYTQAFNNSFGSTYSSSYSSSQQIFTALPAIMFVSLLPTIIINVLTAVSYLLIYKRSKNSDPASNPSAGFTILYVLSIISLVSACVVSFVLVIAMFVIFFALLSTGTYTGYRSSQGITAALLIFLIIYFAAIIFLLLFVAINKLKYFKSIRYSMNSVELSRKGAKPIGVLRIIFTIVLFLSLLMYIFSLISTFVSKDIIYSNTVMSSSTKLPLSIIGISIVSCIISIIYYICASGVALGYARYIDNIKFGYNGFSQSPAQNAPEYTPAQPIQATPANNDQPIPNIQQNNLVTQPGGKYLCPQCNNAVNTDDVFCNQCGYKLK